MKRWPSDFNYLGDYDCDALAERLELADGFTDCDIFSVRCSDHSPLLLLLEFKVTVHGRSAFVSFDIPRELLVEADFQFTSATRLIRDIFLEGRAKLIREYDEAGDQSTLDTNALNEIARSFAKLVDQEIMSDLP